MALRDVPRCQHVKVNGVQCGSPALRRKAYCYFHLRAEHEHQRAAEASASGRTFGFPLLEDANSIQVALMKVIQMLGAGAIAHKTAALMLYGLQTASANLRSTKFEPEKSTDVVIDEDTVDLTRIKGPQWSVNNFHEKAEAESEAQPDGGKQAPAVLSIVESSDAATRVPVLDKELIDFARRREEKRNLPEKSDDEPLSVTERLLKEIDESRQQREQREREEREKEKESGTEADAVEAMKL
jgi:hypothetical protein